MGLFRETPIPNPTWIQNSIQLSSQKLKLPVPPLRDPIRWRSPTSVDMSANIFFSGENTNAIVRRRPAGFFLQGRINHPHFMERQLGFKIQSRLGGTPEDGLL